MQLFVRHSMKSKLIGGLNGILTDEQKGIISQSPFKWFLELKDDIKLGRNILSDLLERWDHERGGFCFGGNFVELKEIDVTLSLGLGLDGEHINLKEKRLGKSDCRKHFAKAKGKYDLQVIYDFILNKQKKLASLDVCRLYILVGISEILLPNLYQYLLSSFSKACTTWKEGKCARDVYVEGCVYVLQVWFCDRFVPSNNLVHKNPRILHWIDVNVGDNFIKSAMETGVTLDDYGPSMREMRQPFVRASFNAAGEEVRKKAHSNSPTNEKQMKDVDDGLDAVLEEQEAEIKELEEELAALKTKLGREEDDCNTEIVMKHYMHRKRFKSAVCKTPYTGYRWQPETEASISSFQQSHLPKKMINPQKCKEISGFFAGTIARRRTRKVMKMNVRDDGGSACAAMQISLIKMLTAELLEDGHGRFSITMKMVRAQFWWRFMKDNGDARWLMARWVRFCPVVVEVVGEEEEERGGY
ncbi:hypothetical protein V8G54_008757 [Vigna mungo]|uniref:Aminotransferase-like plant mobile domain-containing protein n=1 Tax=Vigna mungo TaxID=3915 RepID=A0AAQ3P4F4_VIGMU